MTFQIKQLKHQKVPILTFSPFIHLSVLQILLKKNNLYNSTTVKSNEQCNLNQEFESKFENSNPTLGF